MTEIDLPAPDLVNNTEASRYEIRLDGTVVGFADYHLRPEGLRLEGGGAAVGGAEVVVIPHTETSPAYGGQGLGSKLVRFALDDIVASGRRVDPMCPFVSAYIERHPEYAKSVV